MSAVVAGRIERQQTCNPNAELVGQGIANIFSPLFGGLPATGAIARTATNIRSGAKITGMVHAATLLGIVLCRVACKIYPSLCFAAILLVAPYKTAENGEKSWSC